MFGRFLSFLSFIPGLSGLSGMAGGYGLGSGSSTEDGMEAEGEAAVSFTPGQPLATADAEETLDSRRERITDRDLVWAGKTETIHIGNPEPIAYRFDLTVTDLNPGLYLRRPPLGGVPQREGGILLQPGEEASFEVVFVPPPLGEKLKTRTFSFVLTCFDPRRAGDPGRIVQELPLRWVTLPTEADLQISAVPPAVVIRPWRREARFAVHYSNKSFLPSTVGMTIVRAPTKDVLGREPETVGTIQQSLAARTPGVWQCVLPPPTRRGSYYALVRGAAQAAESVSTPLVLARPIPVRYVPWLRMGRDWAALIGVLLLLFWLIWGIPVRKTPIVRVGLTFAGLDAGQMPPDSQLKDLSAQMILLDERGHDLEGQPPATGIVNNGAFEFTGPTRLYGFRWPLGHRHWWNLWSREPQRFRVTVAPSEAEKNAFRRYDLNALQADGKPHYSAVDADPPFGPLSVPAMFTVPAVHGVLVSLQMGHLGALTGKDLRKVIVRYRLDGQEQPPRTFELIHDTEGGLRPITLDLTDSIPLGGSKPFTVKVTADGLSSYDIQEVQVRRRDEPLPIVLTFPDSYPKAATEPAAKPPPTDTPQTTPVSPTGGQNPPGPPPLGGGGPPVTPPVSPVHPFLPPVHPPVVPKNHPAGGGKPGTAPGGGSVLPLPTPLPGSSPKLPPIQPTVPVTPSGLVAQPVNSTQINVRWNPVPGAVKYILYRSGGPESGKGERYLSGNETSYSDTRLTPGVIYQYRIQSKVGSIRSLQSNPTSVLTPALTVLPATVTVTLLPKGKNLTAVLSFTNVSRREVYLDKVSACTGSKIGDDVFRILADGQPVPFNGQKSKRPSDPGGRQFITLGPGENVREEVTLNASYQFPSGSHTYSVVYSAPHNYPSRLQRLTLTSPEASAALTR